MFCLAVLGFLINTGQLVYYLLMLRISLDNLGGKWVFIGYAMGYVTIMLGAFRLRRAFTILLALGCLYSIPFTAFFTWEIVRDFWQDILSGGLSLARIFASETWYLIGNTLSLSIDIGVLLYLLSYEFRLFGPGRTPKM